MIVPSGSLEIRENRDGANCKEEMVEKIVKKCAGKDA